MKRLVIDLGHGGTDPGAVGPSKIFESNIVLAIGKKLNELLKGFNVEIKFTRLTDTYLSLSERSKIANDFRADYFLSIHTNSVKDSSVRGVEVWQYANDNITLNTFSNGVCMDISKIFNIRNRGVKLSRELSVLKNTKMPAALVEVDFISNPKAEQELKDSSNIEAVAMIIRNNLIELLKLQVQPSTETNTLYRVCIGAYRDKNNALNQVKCAQEKGFRGAYII